MATGDRGLGYSAVYGKPRINTAAEFEELWIIQQLVLQVADPDRREELSTQASVRRALALERKGLTEKTALQSTVLDPMTATPEQIAAYMKQFSHR